MYRSASRYESSRSIPEKPSRSIRSTWVEPQQNRPYSTVLDDDERGILGDPYLAEDAHVLDARDFQHKVTSNSGGTDLREAQRLAANFFSQYPSASTAPEPSYRDAARLTRPFSPEVPIDRYPPRGSQYRERDVGVDRWPGHPKPDPLFPSSSRSQLVLEDWEEERISVDNRRERDLYGVAPARGRKMDDVAAWDDTDYDYGVGRKEVDCPPIQTTGDLDGGGLRVTKRLDWTGLLRSDGNRTAAPVEDGLGPDLRLNKQRGAPSQTYRAGGGRPYVDSYNRDGLEDELNSEGSRRGRGFYGTGQRYRELDVRKEQPLRGNYMDEPRRPERHDFLLGRSLGSSRGASGERGGRGGREDWRMDPREASAGQGQQRVLDSERGRDKRRFEDKDSRRPFFSGSSRHSGGGSGTGADRGRDMPNDSSSFQFGKGGGGRYGAPKRDFSQRASITNQDILAVYYGNQGPGRQPSKFSAPTRGYPYPSGPSRQYTQPRRPQPHRSSRSPPFHGRPGLHNFDLDSSRKGKKRWEKPGIEGSEGKRFKRETQSDKLYLMHNSKAKSEEKDQEAAAATSSGVAEREAEEIKEVENKAEEVEPAVEDTQEATNAAVQGSNPPEPIDGLWADKNLLWGDNNDDSWSDSEEEKQTQMTWAGPSTNDGCELVERTGEERDHATLQALQSGAVDDCKKFLGECSEGDEDDDADWESLASDLDDQLDDVCVHQGAEAHDVIAEDPDNKGVEPLTNSEAQASETNGRGDIRSVAQSQDSEMVDIDDIERSEEGKKEVSEVDSSVKEGSGGIEKKKVGVIMEELQESVKNREDKAFDYYVSLFEQDTDLMKLYEANVNCGSFECLVCAGVRAKKKKRFPDVTSLVQHAKKILRTKKLPEHRGFARAVCKILGWETVPGPSVILPRGCIPQQSDPLVVPVPAPKEQVNLRAKAGDGGNALELEKEWAAARQLFEEQEARINLTTKSSGALLQTDNSAISWLRPSIDRKNPDTALGLGGVMAVVETTSEFAKPATTNDISVPGNVSLKTCPVEFVSDSAKFSTVRAVSVLETAAVEALPVLENGEVAKAVPASQLTVVEATAVQGKPAVGDIHSLTDNYPVPKPSIACEIATVVSTPEDLERSYPEVEMWAPLPREEIDEDNPTLFSVVDAPPLSVKGNLSSGVDLLVGKSPGGRTDESGSSVEVAKRSPSEVDPGLPVTGIVVGDIAAKVA